jgi:hypothetical protein
MTTSFHSSDIGPAAQLSRFNTSQELVDYVCKTSTPTSYIPVCEYPYINAGWEKLVKVGSTDYANADQVTLGDCSMTMAESLEPVGYNAERFIQMSASGVVAVLSLFLLLKLRAVRHTVRKAARTSRSSYEQHAPSPSEVIAILNLISSVCQAVCWIDYWGYSRSIPYILTSILKAISASCMLAIPMVIITKSVELISTVGVVSRATAQTLKRRNITIIILAGLIETNLSILECLRGQHIIGTNGAYSGTINAIKSLLTGLIYFWYMASSVYYGHLVARALSKTGARTGGGAEENGYRVMRVYFFGSATFLLLGVVYKASTLRFYGKNVVVPPPCAGEYFDIVGALLLSCEMLVACVQLVSYLKMIHQRNSRRGPRAVNMGKAYSEPHNVDPQRKPLLDEHDDEEHDPEIAAEKSEKDDDEEGEKKKESGEMLHGDEETGGGGEDKVAEFFMRESEELLGVGKYDGDGEGTGTTPTTTNTNTITNSNSNTNTSSHSTSAYYEDERFVLPVDDSVCGIVKKLMDPHKHYFWFSLFTSLTIGTVLNGINQGDAIINGDAVIGYKIWLTYLMPWIVVNIGGYNGLRSGRRGGGGDEHGRATR